MKIEEIKEELETQKQINKDCEVEYRRVVTQYNEVVKQNRQLQTELSKYKENHKAIIEKIKDYESQCDTFCTDKICSSCFIGGAIELGESIESEISERTAENEHN